MKQILIVVFISYSLLFGPGCAQIDKSPEPRETVVLVHGFARNKWAMWKLAERLEEAGYFVYRVSYSSITQNMDQIKEEVFLQIDNCCAHSPGRVHFVGHSLGGLLIRSYLGEHKVSHLGNVVMMGSPNQGTPLVDWYQDRWWFSLAGPAIRSLSAHGSRFLQELPMPNYNLGVIAGLAEKERYEHILRGQDDGIVPVESTKVPGMADFVVLKTSHTRMRSDKNVARQTISFLKKGHFSKPPSVLVSK